MDHHYYTDSNSPIIKKTVSYGKAGRFDLYGKRFNANNEILWYKCDKVTVNGVNENFIIIQRSSYLFNYYDNKFGEKRKGDVLLFCEKCWGYNDEANDLSCGLRHEENCSLYTIYNCLNENDYIIFNNDSITTQTQMNIDELVWNDVHSYIILEKIDNFKEKNANWGFESLIKMVKEKKYHEIEAVEERRKNIADRFFFPTAVCKKCWVYEDLSYINLNLTITDEKNEEDSCVGIRLNSICDKGCEFFYLFNIGLYEIEQEEKSFLSSCFEEKSQNIDDEVHEATKTKKKGKRKTSQIKKGNRLDSNVGNGFSQNNTVEYIEKFLKKREIEIKYVFAQELLFSDFKMEVIVSSILKKKKIAKIVYANDNRECRDRIFINSVAEGFVYGVRNKLKLKVLLEYPINGEDVSGFVDYAIVLPKRFGYKKILLIEAKCKKTLKSGVRQLVLQLVSLAYQHRGQNNSKDEELHSVVLSSGTCIPIIFNTKNKIVKIFPRILLDKRDGLEKLLCFIAMVFMGNR